VGLGVILKAQAVRERERIEFGDGQELWPELSRRKRPVYDGAPTLLPIREEL